MARPFLTQRLAVVATIDPASISAGTAGSTAVDMRRYPDVVFLLQTGSLGASATVDMKLQSGATSSPTTDITGKSITQLTKASNDNNQVMLGIRRSDLPAGHSFVRALVTVGTAASQASLVGLAEADGLNVSLSKTTLVQVVNA